ncbi:DUF2059 domain-containing protein [Vibrio hangzhouensis]|uniref:DUF2059 domain-containing protein n=1 Tax=Vibrio hangzhouensis TaxID=462991 RepID=UPI001C945A0B|nr:DUF2059 domain-containing protein [Vibrio hangzhouensis]MBY6198180.1 DUF2059 domain-containing protein [Vibrio hangzhouensis]
MKCLNKAITLLVVFFSINSWASSHEDAAHELMDAMELNQLMSETIDSMLEMQLQTNPQLQPFESTIREFFAKYMSGESLRGSFVELYMSAYTENELREIAAFLKTPTGKKLTRLTPMLTAKGAAIGQKQVMENAHVLEKMIKEEADRIKQLQGK